MFTAPFPEASKSDDVVDEPPPHRPVEELLRIETHHRLMNTFSILCAILERELNTCDPRNRVALDRSVRIISAHGGLHQKWFNLYDEATRVPFAIARIGEGATSPRVVTAPTSHVDLVPTLLGAAGVDVAAVAATLAKSFSEVHPLPGRDLMPVVDGAEADDTRAVYLMTRDNMLEGDSGASGLARSREALASNTTGAR